MDAGHLGKIQGRDCNMASMDGFWLGCFCSTNLGWLLYIKVFSPVLPLPGVPSEHDYRNDSLARLIENTISTVQAIPMVWDK